MAEKNWTYMLRILRKNPDQIRMDRLAEYMREFAGVLGIETFPIFKGIKKASTGLKVKIPHSCRHRAWKNVQEAKSVPASRSARSLRSIEKMLGEDNIQKAELIDSSDQVVYLFRGIDEAPAFLPGSIRQQGTVDGTITGLVGADDTMHLYIRDFADRTLRLLVRDEDVARQLLSHFRRGNLRFTVEGAWQRTEDGWIPETSKCLIESYEVLDDAPLTEIFESIAAIPGNGWNDVADPQGFWREIRGIN